MTCQALGARREQEGSHGHLGASVRTRRWQAAGARRFSPAKVWEPGAHERDRAAIGALWAMGWGVGSWLGLGWGRASAQQTFQAPWKHHLPAVAAKSAYALPGAPWEGRALNQCCEASSQGAQLHLSHLLELGRLGFPLIC